MGRDDMRKGIISFSFECFCWKNITEAVVVTMRFKDREIVGMETAPTPKRASRAV
jgi:hypothetical protein